MSLQNTTQRHRGLCSDDEGHQLNETVFCMGRYHDYAFEMRIGNQHYSKYLYHRGWFRGSDLVDIPKSSSGSPVFFLIANKDYKVPNQLSFSGV